MLNCTMISGPLSWDTTPFAFCPRGGKSQRPVFLLESEVRCQEGLAPPTAASRAAGRPSWRPQVLILPGFCQSQEGF